MKLIHKALTFLSLALLVSVVSCSHPRRLQSITIEPSTETVTGSGAGLANFPVKLTALGHFTHPVETIDISNEVTWASNIPMIATVDNTGLVTPTGNGSCGTTLITATAHKGVIGTGQSNAIVVGTATFTVNDTNNSTCGGTQPVLSVAVSGTGSVNGTINNNATSIAGCTQTGGANCVANVATGTAVVLNSSVPATFGPNCNLLTTSSCQVVMNGNQNVTVTFP